MHQACIAKLAKLVRDGAAMLAWLRCRKANAAMPRSALWA